MSEFTHDGIRLAFRDEGPRDGEPILLIHGFASNARINWFETGWTKTLVDAGYRVIAIDNRGHGESEKLYEPDAYTPDLMAEDAVALMDHLSIRRFHLFGYSMGARISTFLALRHPDRVATLILGGLGIALIEGVGDWTPVADALLADDPETLSDKSGMGFRIFADRSGSDRKALAACIRANRIVLDANDVRSIEQPVLVAVGTEDEVAGSADELAAIFPKGEAFAIQRRDHMLATGDRSFRQKGLQFLGNHPLNEQAG